MVFLEEKKVELVRFRRGRWLLGRRLIFSEMERNGRRGHRHIYG